MKEDLGHTAAVRLSVALKMLRQCHGSELAYKPTVEEPMCSNLATETRDGFGIWAPCSLGLGVTPGTNTCKALRLKSSFREFLPNSIPCVENEPDYTEEQKTFYFRRSQEQQPTNNLRQQPATCQPRNNNAREHLTRASQS